MKRPLTIGLLVTLTACTQNNAPITAGLIGTHDLVFVDQLGENSTVASVTDNGDGTLTPVGVPARYGFITSADTNELRVLELFRPNFGSRDFVRAPNPLESLSIPVLDRPTMLATDEGRNSLGQRVTSQYVYAARPSGSELSVVSLAAKRQLGGHPTTAPGPVLALAGMMDVVGDQLPAKTALYVATWDGADTSLFVTDVPTDAHALDDSLRAETFKWKRVLNIPGVPVSALLAIAPNASRTLDGQPFCAAAMCLAIAARSANGGTGNAWLLEPSTGKLASLAFPGPVRKLASGVVTRRLYALLDESACGGTSCGGVVAVDLLAGSGGAFPRATNALGKPFGPIRVTDGLLTGLAIGQGAELLQLTEASSDAGTPYVTQVIQSYDELGAFASSEGFITFFSGLSGSIIDYDGRRAQVSGATVRLPGQLEDGGFSLATADGGFAGVFATAVIDAPNVLEQTFRTATVTWPGDNPVVWSVDVSDGYFLSQDFLLINNGLVPGLTGIAVTVGTTTFGTGGLETRAEVGDLAVFERGSSDVGFTECGRATVQTIGSGYITVDAFPTSCSEVAQVSIRAAATRPVVAVGSVEGYMGRGTPGSRFTYTRPYILLPAEVVAERTSLSIDLPNPGLIGEGAYVTIGLQAHITPLRVAIDASSAGLNKCASSLVGQVVFGNVSLLQAPTSVNGQSTIAFPWKAFAVVPSGNAVAEVTLDLTVAGGSALNGSNGAACWR
ncbi:MAG: hypothetical protein U0228_19350 [Myxococcaceae bacterium]